MRKKSIELLNRSIADELSAVHQYMFFHFHCDDQDYSFLSQLFKKTAIEEMLHVEKLADRILFLKGEIVMEPSQKVQNITDVKEMLKFAIKAEEEAIKDYNNWANECSKNADSATKTIFEELVLDEERHFGLFDSEMEKLKKFGDKYLALQSIENSKLSNTSSKE